MSKIPLWLAEEYKYLEILQTTAESLSKDYHKLFYEKQRQLYYLKLPSIILSSVSGFASFGSGNFQTSTQNISIGVGCIGLLVSILTTLETFFSVSATMSNARAVSLSLQILSQKIMCELSLPVQDRSTDGLVYLRQAFNEFLQIIEKSPPLQTQKEAHDRILQMRKNLSESNFSHTPRNTPDIELNLGH